MAIPCCGIIVFDEDKTLLVITNSGNYSFPKGKRNKNETDLETAWRELEEESGLTPENVELIKNYYIDELSIKGFPSVRYFVGYLVKKPELLRFNVKELQSVEWYNISEVYEISKFKPIRKTILQNAYAVLKKNIP